uniref:GYF domain-containing protein n=1 Tax=Oryza meridionalis TaxID=40149 RepID=A0A0E0F153_9ORYZ
MDFASRHAASAPPPAPDASSPSSPRASSASSSSAAAEEPEYLARYFVVKHSWRGRYRRILCIASSGLVTLDPATLAVTNSYDASYGFDRAAPEGNATEFTLTLRTDARGKFKALRFSSPLRAGILTELHRLRPVHPVLDFPVLHLRRRTHEWAPFKLKVTSVGIELLEGHSGDLRWCLDFRDMDSPAIILLGDSYGKRTAEGGGFVLCPLYGRKSKAFMAASGSTNTLIISYLTKTANSMVGVSLHVDNSQSMTATDFIANRANEAVGAAETRHGEWSVTRLRPAAHGTASIESLSLGIGPRGGLGDHGDSVSRQLVLTNTSLVERQPENYEAIIVRPLSTVSALVRFAEEPQMFAFEFNDGCPIHVYASTSRDSLLATVLDVLQNQLHLRSCIGSNNNDGDFFGHINVAPYGADVHQRHANQYPTAHTPSPGINIDPSQAVPHNFVHEAFYENNHQTGAPRLDSHANLVDSNGNGDLANSAHSDFSVPAQVVVENTPVGSGRLLCNWYGFWRAFSLDHNRADLIWNERTRQELREALQAEVPSLDVEKERTDDIVPGSSVTEDASDSETLPRISWNYVEFSVSYPSLSKEGCVGQYYLRLLLESGSNYRAQDFLLRDPVAFFRALYHCFLCDADIGLTVDGAVPDELGSSDGWCDLGRLDGFGGGGGSSVRELCSRTMAIVYEQHNQVIGPFDGTAHITVFLDRTDDWALRHRLLLLLKALMNELSNVEACVLVGGCVLAVDMLTVAHEASERTAIPLQSNLIVATAFMEPLKEWMYIDKDGKQVGPLEKDAIRRLWSKKSIDWTTKCWASGMSDWKRLRDIRELRWALAVKVPVLTPSQIGDAALSILHSMASAHSDLDDAGEIVTPTPSVKRILSSPRCLRYVAQAMLTGEPSIVEAAASLLKAIVTRNPKAMIRLYSTGAFYFALAYPDSNLLNRTTLFSHTYSPSISWWFLGRIRFESAPIWKSLPPRCRYFLWLVALDRCWTGDRLRRRGLPHPDHCVLCDQCEESIDHLLVACPKSRQLWWMALRAIGQPSCMPMNETSFHRWFCVSRKALSKSSQRGFDTIITLVAWSIWKERNNRVFNQQNKTWSEVAKAMAGEVELWRLARTAMPALVLQTPVNRSPNWLGE